MSEKSLNSAAGSAADSAADATRRARNSRPVQILARSGYVASGVLHVLVAWLAVRLALGESSGQADHSGALRTLAQVPGGRVLLWAVAVGFAALALWQLAAALVGVANAERRAGAWAKSVGKAALYGVLAASSARYARGDGGGGTSEESTTAMVLGMPSGPWLVGAAGLAIAGVGAYHVVKGLRKKFLRDLVGAGGRAVRPVVVRLGQAGYVAKGIALGVVGGLVVAAAVTADADRAGGLDEALHTVRDQPFGSLLLIVVGLGIGAYGLYSFARARFARL
ncbi:DUF1206 domain-containing protein [Myceligenerans salitolerans]|uniref:DUF1206 domain-containing protein n=1 Tax=Myceligenerans salitolerans TaxID=1230528 RepID=A0ABS3ICR6_9MICO|nr:DUF1206 domain-containing protein [Myceligenerans salitolerans]MBO0610730.1 DUF1206 domain-containing protein [Myceligenerans salitolerans]